MKKRNTRRKSRKYKSKKHTLWLISKTLQGSHIKFTNFFRSYKQDKVFRILRFLILFNIFSLPLYFFSQLNFSLYPLQQNVASLTTFLLESIGIDVNLQNNLISIYTSDGMFAGFIDRDCVGMKMILGFLALCFATEGNIRKKLKSLLFLPLIYIVNVLRVFLVFFLVYLFGSGSFNLIHGIIFNIITVFTIIIFWIVWIKFVK
jgi:exosortase/archaeosortase family protein